MILPFPTRVYDADAEARRNLELEQADAQNWKHTGDVDHPHGLTVRGAFILPHADGVIVSPGSDIDTDLITFDSGGGTAALSWDASEASFVMEPSLRIGRRIVFPFQTFAANDATPSVALGRNFKTANGSATTITDFDDGVDGQEIFVKINDANTTIDFTGSGLEGNAGVNWSPVAGDAMRCVFDGTQWTCAIIDATA